MKWSRKRRKQLAVFESLLREASSLNSGSHVAERILLIGKLVPQLYSIDLDDQKEPDSFFQFLIKVAHDEHAGDDERT